MSLLPAEMLQEVSVERGWGSGGGTGPKALAGMATSHQHWASLSPLALAQGPPHLCALPVCKMELGGMDGRGQAQQERVRGCSRVGES